MVQNNLIDGINIRTTYGAEIGRGGYAALLAWPSLRTPDTEDWPEEDGIEADLAAPTLQAREIDVPFVVQGASADAAGLLLLLSQPGLRALEIPTLGRSWQLRYESSSETTVYRHEGAITLTVRFAEDTPVRPTAGDYTPGISLPASPYSIDGVSLDAYGITVLTARGELLKQPAAKANLSREITLADGRVYDAGALQLQTKDVDITLLARAASWADMLASLDNFYLALIAPGARELDSDISGDAYPCYYKQASSWEVIRVGGEPCLRFTLTLTFTSFRLGETEYLLAAESGALIVLEEDGETAIDMQATL
jgi:hypothetical protein